MRRALFFVIFFKAFALFANADLGVRAQSFGGAIRAVGTTNDVIFYNPAALIKGRHIAPELDYLFDANARRHAFGASIVDSSTSDWALGLAYNGQFFSGRDKSSHLIYMASAMPLGTDLLSLGTSFSYSYNPFINPEENSHFFNMDIGLMTSLPLGFSLAAVLDHVLGNKGNEKDLGFSLAAAYDFSPLLTLPLSFSFDWSMQDVKSDDNLHHLIAAGAQYVAFSLLPIRFGFKSDQKEDRRQISLGSGLQFSALSFDVLYQQDLSVGRFRHFGFALRMAI